MNVSSISAAALSRAAPAAVIPTDSALPGKAAPAEAEPKVSAPRELGLSVLRAEIREVLSARLKLSFGNKDSGYAKISASSVARESYSAANRLLREAPLDAADQLAGLRGDIRAAGSTTRDVVGSSDSEQVDKALMRIDTSLETLEKEAARNTLSSASVLTAESTVKQRSTVRIRTQDGDIVTLRFRQRESISATSASSSSGSVEQLELTSRSRIDLRVRGDLDEGELSAINTVFDRAREIADSFFGGDLAAAFGKASEFEFDRTELDKVRMNFREKEVTRIRSVLADVYPVLEPAVPRPPAESPALSPALERPSDTTAPAGLKAAAKPPEAEPLSNAIAAAPNVDDAPAAKPIEDASTTATGAIERFVADLRNFLRATVEGFEKPDGQRYFYSESFKLSILKSLIETAAPERDDNAADRAISVIDAARDSD